MPAASPSAGPKIPALNSSFITFEMTRHSPESSTDEASSSFWGSEYTCTPPFQSDVDTILFMKIQANLVLLHFSQNNRKDRDFKHLHFFWHGWLVHPGFSRGRDASVLPPFSWVLSCFVPTKAGEAGNSLLCLALSARSCGRSGGMAFHLRLEAFKVDALRCG